jgi:hypothetical protein
VPLFEKVQIEVDARRRGFVWDEEAMKKDPAQKMADLMDGYGKLPEGVPELPALGDTEAADFAIRRRIKHGKPFCQAFTPPCPDRSGKTVELGERTPSTAPSTPGSASSKYKTPPRYGGGKKFGSGTPEVAISMKRAISALERSEPFSVKRRGQGKIKEAQDQQVQVKEAQDQQVQVKEDPLEKAAQYQKALKRKEPPAEDKGPESSEAQGCP